MFCVPKPRVCACSIPTSSSSHSTMNLLCEAAKLIIGRPTVLMTIYPCFIAGASHERLRGPEQRLPRAWQKPEQRSR
jgi:hypothetical protein